MTVIQLTERIAQLKAEDRINDQTDVMLWQLNDDYDTALAEEAVAMHITFGQDEEGVEPAKVLCLVIADHI